MWLWRRARTSEFDFFEQRVGQLLLDGHHVGHIASRLYWAGAGFAFVRNSMRTRHLSLDWSCA